MIYRVRLWEIQNHDLETKSSRAHQWSCEPPRSISYIAHKYCVLITIVGARGVRWVRVVWISFGIERIIIMNLRCRPLFLPSEVVYRWIWGGTRGAVLLLSTSATIPHKMLLIGAQQPSRVSVWPKFVRPSLDLTLRHHEREATTMTSTRNLCQLSRQYAIR